MSEQQNADTLLEFPCDFPIKAMGLNTDEFITRLHALLAPHVGELPNQAIHQQLSRNGRYISVTMTIEAQSKQQLDAIYQALTDEELVLMAL